MRFSRQGNTRVGCHFLLLGIFPTDGLKLHHLHYTWVLYHWAPREALIGPWPHARNIVARPLPLLWRTASLTEIWVLWEMLWDRVKGQNCGLISYQVVWFSGSLSGRSVSPLIREGFSSLIVCWNQLGECFFSDLKQAVPGPISASDGLEAPCRHPETCVYINLSSVQFSRSVVSESLWSRGLQHARLPCPSPIPGACSNSCPLSWWCHRIISSSVTPFSSCL